ncbi:HEPN domain-containing protein [Carnobacterium maltaromaticum]|uniref:HEPN domain-containing protein n=1 Tax=Carnobacterium maltaromaticum TaxID=2751 RepID=UPI0039B01252
MNKDLKEILAYFNSFGIEILDNDYESLSIDNKQLQKEINISFPNDDEPATVDIDFLYDYYKSLQNGTFINDYIFQNSEKVCVRAYFDEYKYQYSVEDISRVINGNNFSISGETYYISFKSGISEFEFYDAKNNFYDDYNQIFMDENCFFLIEGKKAGTLNKDNILEIVEAFIFDVKIKNRLKVKIHPNLFLFINEEDDFIDESKKNDPIMIGKGLDDVIKIFNSIDDDTSLAIKITSYFQIIEYISQTIIRKELIMKAKEKLTSSVLNDIDSDFIIELSNICVENYKKSRKDTQYIKAAIKECCNLNSLSDLAPDWMIEMKKFKEGKPKENDCWNEIANYIVNTRNSLAHAKPNYNPKKPVIGESDFPEFVDFLEVIVIDVIKWFGNVEPDERVVKAI